MPLHPLQIQTNSAFKTKTQPKNNGEREAAIGASKKEHTPRGTDVQKRLSQARQTCFLMGLAEGRGIDLKIKSGPRSHALHTNSESGHGVPIPALLETWTDDGAVLLVF